MNEALDDAIAAAHDATSRQDWEAAVRLWQAVRAAVPDYAAAYASGGWALRELDRLDEADEVLRQGIDLAPRDPWMATHYGWVAMRRQDWSEAAKRWEMVRGRFPDHPHGYIQGGWALREAKRYDEADTVFRVGRILFPDDPWMAIHHAWVAHNHGDWNEAARRWDGVRERFPDEKPGYVDGGWALIEAGRLTEADQVLAVAVEKYPDDHSAAFHYARLAQIQARWREAGTRWAALRDRFPDTPNIERQIQQVLYEIQLDELNENSDEVRTQVGLESGVMQAPDVATRDLSTDLQTRGMLNTFESIGINCEFGLVQRAYGCEYLGFLRWAMLPFEKLLEGLENEFDGLATGENSRVFVSHENELMYEDRKWSFVMHTNISAHADTDMDDFGRKMSARVQFLKKQFFRTLRAADKTLVYSNFERRSEEQIFQLHRALRRHGPVTLMCVRPPETAAPEGNVVLLDEGVFVASINIMEKLLGSQVDISSWVKTCGTAAKLIEACASGAPVFTLPLAIVEPEPLTQPRADRRPNARGRR